MFVCKYIHKNALIGFCFFYYFSSSIASSNKDSSNSYVLKQFSPSNTIVNHLAIDESLGYVYIGAQNSLYQLKKNLNTWIANVTVGPVKDFRNCLPGKECEHEKVLTNNTNRLLLIDKKKDRLIACGSVYQGACITRSLFNISNQLSGIPNDFDVDDIIASNIPGTVVGVIAEGPTVNNSVLYVAATLPDNSFYYRHDKTITTRSLYYDPKRENSLFKYAIQVKIQGRTTGSTLKRPDSIQRFYKYAFHTGGSDGYVYFVLTRKAGQQESRFIVARICKSDHFYYSYFELPITCGDIPSDILTAYYAPNDDKDNLGTLYIVFKTDGASAVCSFTKRQLDEEFFRIANTCFKYRGLENDKVVVKSQLGTNCDNRGKPFIQANVSLESSVVSTKIIPELPYYKNYTVPYTKLLCGAYYLPYYLYATWSTEGKMLYKNWSWQFTAITTVTVENVVVALIGTSAGDILQESDVGAMQRVNFDTSRKYNVINLAPSNHKVLPDLIWDTSRSSNVPQLYVATSGSVLLIRVAVCEKFKTCGECLRSEDPYCGWCILEGRCTTKNDCSTSAKDRTRWLGFGSKYCPYISPPRAVNRNEESEAVTVTVNPLPVLDSRNEKYLCVYNKEIDFPAEYSSLNKTAANVTCRAPDGDDLPETPSNYDYLDVPLTLRYVKTSSGTSTSVDVVSTTLVYYDCSVYGHHMQHERPCAGCLSSRWSCRWCVNEGVCQSASSPGKTKCLSDSTMCPTVTSVARETNLIPVGKAHEIKLLTRNLPNGGTPSCRITLQSGRWFESDSNYVEVATIPTLNYSFVTCDSHVYNYTENKQLVAAFVTFYWKLSFVVDSYSNESSSVTFFKCAVERDDCSRCVTADPAYECGWCDSTRQCTISDFCSGSHRWLTNGSSCPALQVHRFEPSSGPLSGGTFLTIHGVNMGTSVNDVERVMVGSTECVVQKDLYIISLKIVCKTGNVEKKGNVKVVVTVKGHSATAKEYFHYRNPVLSGLSPRKGPMAGGTVLAIEGENLNTGSTVTVQLINENNVISCLQKGVAEPTKLQCVTSQSDVKFTPFHIVATFDNFKTPLQNLQFSYVDNPYIDSASTTHPQQFSSFLLGGRSIFIKGFNFDYVQNPRMSVIFSTSSRKRRRSLRRRKRTIRDYVQECNVTNNTLMTCYTPTINLPEGTPSAGYWPARVRFHLDNIVVDFNTTLDYYPNPEFQKWPKPIEKISNQALKIQAKNLKLGVVTKSEIRVMLGDQLCPVQSIDEDTIFCTVPEPKGDYKQPLDVEVYVSQLTEPYYIGEMVYKAGGSGTNSPPMDIIIPIVVGLVFVVALGISVYCYCKKKKDKAHKSNHQKAMENLEMSVRADFLKAFAELNVDMNDVTAEIEDSGIPCLDYRTYVTNLFFPSFKYHPCMRPRDVSSAIGSKLEQGLAQFHLLLSNRNFLSLFIHTLEEQNSFRSREKGNVASLLTVVLHNKLDYFTEIMKSLVSDLITVNIQRNPKVILRRSESVAERLLSNWMYICLYPYLREKAGSPIFLLLKAIKQQVSKGPVDAVTGRARYTLSDDRLLQEDIEAKVLTLFVTADTSSDEEPVVVKVLSCDSVSQVKEKVMDAVYKRTVFSQRPKADQLDIEWRHGLSGRLVLPTDAYVREPNSRWRRLMTITDYNMPDNATIVLVQKQNEYDEAQEISSALSVHTNDSSVLSPILPEENSLKTYHLVKYTDEADGKRESTINRDRPKHIPEIYLLRLISMKGTLQNYVDTALRAILDTSSIPPPVKHFFDFLDDKAFKHGINDAEVLHIWKTNSLLGRFWMTILKNPDSVFDIENPETIASSMSVISQTFIDACSITDHIPTHVSPINRQLYAKEITTYKKLVQEYYKVIKEQPPVTEQDINAYIADISRGYQCEFDVNAALKELWGYLNKFYEEINENLDDKDDPGLIPIKTKLEQIYHFIGTHE